MKTNTFTLFFWLFLDEFFSDLPCNVVFDMEIIVYVVVVAT